MLICVNKVVNYADKFSKKSANFRRFIISNFGLRFLMIETNISSKILSQLINKSC